MNLVDKFEAKQIEKVANLRTLPNFQPGDTVKVHAKVIEGTNERIQIFEGVVLRRKSRGLSSSFSVKKISNGETVERLFMLHSPRIDKIEIMKRGRVRRAKLYYLRLLTGKAARIKENLDHLIKNKAAKLEAKAAAAAANAANKQA